MSGFFLLRGVEWFKVFFFKFFKFFKGFAKFW